MTEKINIITLSKILRTYYDVQKLRVAVENRVKLTRFTLCPNGHLIPLKSGERKTCPICGEPVKIISQEPDPLLTEVSEKLVEIEKGLLYAYLERDVSEDALWKAYLRKIKGIGPVLGDYLVRILNPARFDTVSKMWKYSGLHVVDGKAPRRTAGQKVDWSPFARTMAWKIGESFRKVGGFYRMMYEKFFDECRVKHKDWTAAHCLNHARRVTVKLFLAHYHYVGRKILGLPVREPYSCVVKPHECIPPILDRASEEDRKAFYHLYLKDTWTWQTYNSWNLAYFRWLKEKEIEKEETEE